MNRIQKTTTAFIALTITLGGAILATAPLSLADSRWAVSHLRSCDRQVVTNTVCAAGTDGLLAQAAATRRGARWTASR